MNAKGEYEKLKDKLSITIKFIKESYVQLTEKQREILDARRAKFFK
jgi:predicted DNA binding protein